MLLYIMCIQVIERHAICKCRYYKHALDPCQRCGQRRHVTQVREVLVGYACAMHQFNNSLKTCLESIEIRAPFRPSWGWSFKTTASGDVASAFDSYYKEHIAGKMRYVLTPKSRFSELYNIPLTARLFVGKVKIGL